MELEALLAICEANAREWFAVSTRGNPDFIDSDTIDALDVAVAWQSRAAMIRQHLQ